MKIVVVDTTIDEELIGGAQTFLAVLIKGLADRGNEVHLVTKGNPNQKLEAQLHQSGAILHTSIWKKNALPVDAAVIFGQWINDLQPDIYLVSVSADVGWLVLPYLDSGIATFTIGHTDDETFYAPARHYQPFITRAIGVSDEVVEQYSKSCNFSASAVTWIPYGVTTKTLSPDLHTGKTIQLIYVGRVVEEQKRISDLIKIVQQLVDRNFNFHLKIVGDGPQMSLLKEMLQQPIADQKVILLGWLKSEEVVQQLHQSDIFLLTSAYEGFCIALVEAMANGCCPLVTDIKSGNKQLITNGENGFIFPIGDINSFVEKIIFLSVSPAKMQELRGKAWETGKEFSVARMIDNYIESFTSAAATVKTYPRKSDRYFPVMDSCRSAWPLWIRRLKATIQ